MASVERTAFTQSVPTDAAVRTEKGRRYACWVDRKGAAVKAIILPSGRCRRTLSRWVGTYRDGTGAKCKTETYGDRNAALAAALDAERRGRAVAEGREVPDRPPPKSRLIDLLPDYLAHLRDGGTGGKRVAEVERIVTRIVTDHKLTTPTAVDCGELARQLERDRREGPPKGKGGTPAEVYSYRSRNLWVATLRAFGRWAVRKAKACPANPFDGLDTVNDAPHKTRHRRAVPVGELQTLIDVTHASPVERMGLSGVDRAMMYLIGSHTGLRAGALLKLTPEAFTWSDGLPVAVHSSARLQKNKSAHGVDLVPAIRAAVGGWLADRPPGLPIFPAHVTARTADMIREDLAAARTAWIAEGKTDEDRRRRAASNALTFTDAAGQVFDFHSLRVQTGFMLAAGGVSLAAAQKILDHSNPKLTSDIYSKFGGEMGGEHAKMKTLPRLAAAPSLGSPLGTVRDSSPAKEGSRTRAGKGRKTKKPHAS